MKKIPRKLLLLFGLIALGSCSSNSTDDLLESQPFVENVTYNENIKSIIDNNCVSCHSDPPVNGAPMQLTNFAQVRQAVLDRGLIGRISRAQGESGMMPNGGIRLPQPTIDLIVKWRDQGLQN